MIKILAVSGLPLGLGDLFYSSARLQFNASKEVAPTLTFLMERLGFYLQGICGIPAEAVNAVLAASVDTVPDAEARGRALAVVLGTKDIAAIAAAWKRTKNILRQSAEKGFAIPDRVEPALMSEAAERNLWQVLTALIPEVEQFRSVQNYAGALEAIARLRPHVDRFFDETMVLVDDRAVRGNRLALLERVVRELGRIADFSELAPVAEPVAS